MSWPNTSGWTPERIAAVRSMAADNFTASQIANELGGVSRNAVIGIGFRQKIKFYGRAGVRHKASAPPKPRPPRLFIPKAPKMPSLEPEEFAVIDDVPEMHMLTFEQLQWGDCKFIIGDPQNQDHRYCGLPALDGKPWCIGHWRLCYRAPEERRRDRPKL